MSEAVLCLCNGLTEAAVAAALAAGARRPAQIYAACGCTAQCGTCARMLLAALRASPADAMKGEARPPA